MNNFYENRRDELKAARDKVDEVQSKLCDVYECLDCPMRATQGCFLDNVMSRIASAIERLYISKAVLVHYTVGKDIMDDWSNPLGYVNGYKIITVKFPDGMTGKVEQSMLWDYLTFSLLDGDKTVGYKMYKDMWEPMIVNYKDKEYELHLVRGN
ncbi:hypothetical protein [uncultured Mitsuokella sp.]|uniref:hypothetical protein n=1 Tax=uncultured Mitsuokella sp. TaxID=453120 RepID=UPI00259A3825|nr:hypothetical protein [uncultured Mitsuokella sp.]